MTLFYSLLFLKVILVFFLPYFAICTCGSVDLEMMWDLTKLQSLLPWVCSRNFDFSRFSSKILLPVHRVIA
jgi:hypothetical protein